MTTIKYRSPKGVAHYPALVRPDTRFNPEGMYKVGLIVEAEDAEELIRTCREAFTDEFGKKKNLAQASMPFKAQTDEEGNETGKVVISFSSKNKPKFFDSHGNGIEDTAPLAKLGGGSTLRINGSIAVYNAGGKVGVKIYLNAVQVIKLVEYQGGGFTADEDAEDGFVIGKGTSEGPGKDDNHPDEDEEYNF